MEKVWCEDVEQSDRGVENEVWRGREAPGRGRIEQEEWAGTGTRTRTDIGTGTRNKTEIGTGTRNRLRLGLGQGIRLRLGLGL